MSNKVRFAESERRWGRRVPISQKKVHQVFNIILVQVASHFFQFLRQAKMVQSALFQISSGFFPPIFFDLSELGKVLCEFTSYFIHPNMHMITDKCASNWPTKKKEPKT